MTIQKNLFLKWLFLFFFVSSLAAADNTPGFEMVLQSGNHMSIDAAVISPDGKYVACGGMAGIVHIWRIADGMLIRQINVKPWLRIEQLIFSHDGRRIYVGGIDTSHHHTSALTAYETHSGKYIRSIGSSNRQYFRCVVSKDNKTLIADYMRGRDSRIVFFDLEKNSPRKQPVNERGALFFSRYGTYALLLNTASGTLFLYDTRHMERVHNEWTLKPLKTKHHSNNIHCAFSRDEKTYAVCARYKKHSDIFIGSTVSGKQIHQFQRQARVYKIALSPNGSKAALRLGDKKGARIEIIDIQQKRVIWTKKWPHWLSALCFTPAGEQIMAAYGSFGVRFWNVNDGKQTLALVWKSRFYNFHFWSKDSRYLISSRSRVDGGFDHRNNLRFWSKDSYLTSSRSGVANIFDLENGLQCRTVPVWFHEYHSQKDIIAATWLNQASIWQTGSWKPLLQWPLPKQQFSQLMFLAHPDLVLELRYRENLMQVRNYKTGKILSKIRPHKSYFSSFYFSPCRNFTITGGNDRSELRLWSLPDLKMIWEKKRLNYYRGEAIRFSPQSRYFAVLVRKGKQIESFRGIRCMDMTIVELATLKPVACVKRVSFPFIFSGDERYLYFFAPVPNGYRKRKISFQKFDIARNKIIESVSLTAQRTLIWLWYAKRQIAISPQDDIIALGQKSGAVSLYRTTPLSFMRNIPNGDTYSLRLGYSPNGKYLASTNADCSQRIWNTENWQSVTMLPYGREKDWIVYTDDGYFDCSLKGSEGVAMVTGMQAYSVDQFALVYNRPDIICKRLGIASPERVRHFENQYLRRRRRLGLSATWQDLEAQGGFDLHVPTAVIRPDKPAGKFVTAAFDFADAKYDLARYTVYVNGVPLYGAAGRPLKGRSANIRLRIELSGGDNQIEASCLNTRGAESFRALAVIPCKEKTTGDLYVLALGVSEYQNKSYNLKFAHKDALDMARLCANMKGRIFRRVHQRALINNQVTRPHLEKAVGFLKTATVDDTVIVFFAGHGLHAGKRNAAYYFLAHDARAEKPAEKGIPFAMIETVLYETAARRKLLVLDTCESGFIDTPASDARWSQAEARGLRPRTRRALVIRRDGKTQGRAFDDFERDRLIYQDVLRHSGTVVFSSCRGDELSYERDQLQNGLFTHAFVAAFSGGADKNKNSRVSLSELQTYVARTVKKESAGLQTPVIDHGNRYASFEFPVAEKSGDDGQ